MYRSSSLLSLVCAAVVVVALSFTNANAQKTKSSNQKSTAAKSGKSSDAKSDAKSAKNKPVDKKEDKKASKSKDSAKSPNNRAEAKSKGKSEETARGKSSEKDKKADKRTEDKNKDDKRGKDDGKTGRRGESRKEAEARREAEERRRQAAIEAERREAERRAAIEAERRRREQARREAIARQQAFERGLREETVNNILSDDTTSEELDVRRAAIDALGDHAGTVVVMDAQNGRVVSMVNQKWAIGQGFKPCSTIKLVTGVAGINEKVIDETGGLITSRAPMDLTDALAYSNNGYFQKVGGSVGYSKMMSYARELGLGATTGINVGGESPGKLPEPKSGFPLNRMSSHGDDFEVTPLQLATMVSAIANGGNLVTPKVVRSKTEMVSFRPTIRRKLNVPQQTLQGVFPGMLGAVGYGTAKRAFDSSLNIGGKTGSCIGQGSWLGLFASVAPLVNPKYAVVVVTRGQKERGKYAAAIAGKVYQALGSRIRANKPPQPMIAGSQQPAITPPKPKVDAKTAARLSDEERDEEGIKDDEAEGGDFANGKSAPKQNNSNNKVSNPRVLVTSTLGNTNSSPQTNNKVIAPQSSPAPETQNVPAQRRPRIVQNARP